MKTDALLKNDVLDELAWDPVVKSTDVGVIVKDGIVTLAGTLASYAEKFAAERAAQRVGGVKGLVVQLEVQLPTQHERTDADIALAAERALAWSTLVPAGQVQVMVEKGHVTLGGEVGWEYQRAAAERTVRELLGVTGLTNLVRLAPQVQPAQLQQGIHDALARQADREAQKIQVAVSGSTVTLTGRVHSWAERDAAMGAAWAAPGVAAIVNEIVVD
jgi:osmotically-inducible protein OsmY